MVPARRFARGFSVVLMAVAPAGCKAKHPPMMRTPALYSSTTVADLDNITLEGRRSTTIEILYATDRLYETARRPDPFPGLRQGYLRVGTARVRLGPEEMTWPELAAASTSLERKSGDVRISLETIEDLGPLVDTLTEFDVESREADVDEPAARFAAMVNERLAESTRKNVFVYVSPFKIDFDLACFTTAEFHHFMGRNGVAIAYSWPTGTRFLDYFSATENAYLTVRNLRIFLEYLARETDAERINLMTYSAGARVLSGALQELALKYGHLGVSEARDRLRIGQVIYTGPDIDREAFVSHYDDGAGLLCEGLTIYTTPRDRALAMSQWIFGWQRLGSITVEDLTPRGIDYLERTTSTALVKVTNAEEALRGNAHAYFRESPWVSSDILLILALALPPEERALYREEGDPVWHFPDDYREQVARLIERLKSEDAGRSTEAPVLRARP